MEHQLRIGIGHPPADGGLVACRRVGLRERTMQRLLGKKQRLTILVPGDSVRSLSITQETGGDHNGK